MSLIDLFVCFFRDSPLSSSQLADVCFVIDALGEDTRNQFQKTFCTNQMSEYSKTFRTSDEVIQFIKLKSKKFEYFCF